MRYIFFIFLFACSIFARVIEAPVVGVNANGTRASIKVDYVDVGVSGFVVHHITAKHNVIVNNATVISFDKNTKIATLSLSRYDALRQNSLPDGKWKAVVGDTALLAFGYTRGILIAPNEKIYYTITRVSTQLQWIHPDVFATVLSFAGHPTPLRQDFTNLSKATSIGLVFFYLQGKLYTVDIKSFKILNITDAPLKQKKVKLPFYTRIGEIDAAWWGEGSEAMTSYEPHYFALLKQANPNNKILLAEIERYNKKAKK